MNWTNEPATESQLGRLKGLGYEPDHPLTQGEAQQILQDLEGPQSGGGGAATGTAAAAPQPPHEIIIRRRSIEAHGKEVEVFTMSMGSETMELVPLLNWGQLDIHKWRVRGKLPGTPPGLEITHESVRVAGETVSIKDPDGCAKLERVFNEWLALERGTLQEARKKAQAKPVAAARESAPQAEQPIRFEVEVDKRGQVHVKSVQGKEVIAAIGLNVAGFNSLFSQGLMRKPHKLQVGALHDWVEIDGEMYSFEKGRDDSGKLQNALNQHYLPLAALGMGKDVVISVNAASPTGFDIQFPTSLAGVRENRKRHLNEEALDLLQEPTKCGLLREGLVIKLAPPTLIFKRKTPDGGERYLDQGPADTVNYTSEEGETTFIDLSKPVNYLHLSAAELTAVFNHPAINRSGKTNMAANAGAPQPKPPPVESPAPVPVPPQQPVTIAVPPAVTPVTPPPPPVAPPPQPAHGLPFEIHAPDSAPQPVRPPPPPPKAQPKESEPKAQPTQEQVHAGMSPAAGPEQPKLAPNAWLKDVLGRAPIRHDWFACLVYGAIAEHLGNSEQGRFGLSACWSIALGETADIAEPEFKGIFLTEKGGFGFVNHGELVRFNKGVVFVGTQETGIEGIEVSLVAVGMDGNLRIVFIVNELSASKFGVPEPAFKQELGRLVASGALVMSVAEVLRSPEPLDIVWTVPAEQEDALNPQVVESMRPGFEIAPMEEEPLELTSDVEPH